MLSDVKTGITTAVFYALMTASFVYTYHTAINPEYHVILKEQALERIKTEKANQALDESFVTDPTFATGQTKEDIKENTEDTIADFITPNKTFPMTFLSGKMSVSKTNISQV